LTLFDLRPKYRREDLFDREEELKELSKTVEQGKPLIALIGIRRVGKTSILKTFLNEANGIYIDMRGIVRRSDLELRVSDAFSSTLDKTRKFLESIRGVEILGFSVEIRWRGRDSVSFVGLLSEINKKGKRFVVVLDELQSVKPPLSAELRNVIAYSYDNLENIVFIVAGSEIGLLYNFLGYENPLSPLYGRYVHVVTVERFDRDLAREFLVKGFREEGVEPPREAIEIAIDFFDGIVGWLVFFGRKYVDGYRDFENLKMMAVDLAREELSKLSSREKIVLKAIALGNNSWSKVRSFIAEKYGVVLPKSTLSRIIEKLEMLSIVKDYRFLDPVYREAAKTLSP
jgi:AAA+ ATPase superfamily predicted ATPase